jgi:hypothetical protein
MPFSRVLLFFSVPVFFSPPTPTIPINEVYHGTQNAEASED